MRIVGRAPITVCTVCVVLAHSPGSRSGWCSSWKGAVSLAAAIRHRSRKTDSAHSEEEQIGRVGMRLPLSVSLRMCDQAKDAMNAGAAQTLKGLEALPHLYPIHDQ